MSRVAVALAAATIVFGYVGLAAYAGPPRAGAGPLSEFFRLLLERRSFQEFADLLFRAAQLLVLSQPDPPPDNGWFAVARITAFGFTVTAVAGILFALFESLRTWWARKWIALWSRLRPDRAHVVVLGLGRAGSQIVEDLRSDDPDVRKRAGPKRRVIAVESGGSTQAVARARRQRALVLVGDAKESVVRDLTLLDRAHEVFVACGDDALNVDIARGLAIQPARGRRLPHRRLRCWLHLGEPEFSDLLMQHEFLAGGDGRIDYRVFNMWQNAARELLLDEEKGLATSLQPADHEVPYYIIFGFGAMGRTVALQIARLAHFPGLWRPRLTILDDFAGDPEAGLALNRFQALYPGFCPLGGIDLADHIARPGSEKDRWEARSYRVDPGWRVDQERAVEYVTHAEFKELPSQAESARLIEELRVRLDPKQDPPVKPAIIVCFAEGRKSVTTAIRLRTLLSCEPADSLPEKLPIFVYLPREEGLARCLEGMREDERLPVVVFGSLADSAGYRAVTRPIGEEIAMMINLSYSRHVISDDRPWKREEALATAREAWDALDPWERLSNHAAANHTVVKLRSLGYTYRPRRGDEKSLPVDVDRLAPVEHNRWVADMLVSGWRFEPYPTGYEALTPEEKAGVRREMASRRRRAPLVPWGPHLSDEDKAKDRDQIEKLVWAVENAGQVIVPAR